MCCASCQHNDVTPHTLPGAAVTRIGMSTLLCLCCDQIDMSLCDYIVDLELPSAANSTSAHEPYFPATPSNTKTVFKSVWSAKYLHNPSSPALTRSLFVPFLTHKYNSYGTYHVLANSQRLKVDVKAFPGKKKRLATAAATTSAAATPVPTAVPEEASGDLPSSEL
jgi:hypothetical protein